MSCKTFWIIYKKEIFYIFKLTFENEENFLKKFLLLSLFNDIKKQEKKSLSKKYCSKDFQLEVSVVLENKLQIFVKLNLEMFFLFRRIYYKNIQEE